MNEKTRIGSSDTKIGTSFKYNQLGYTLRKATKRWIFLAKRNKENKKMIENALEAIKNGEATIAATILEKDVLKQMKEQEAICNGWFKNKQ